MTTTMAAKDLDWCIDGANWPHRKASTFVEAGGIRWHVQRMGAGPVLLLVHGTGASTHSWRTLMPLLAERFSVIAPDLPGHGYTQIAPGSGMSLPGMSRLLQQLLDAVGAKPACVVGHSAGAAILARMAIDGRIAPAALVSLNGAFVPLGGMLRFLSPIARLMAATPLVARVFAGRAADPKALDRLLESTGSRLDATGTALYARLVQSPAHMHGALTMMANWDLDPLLRDLARLRCPRCCWPATTIAPCRRIRRRRWRHASRVRKSSGCPRSATSRMKKRRHASPPSSRSSSRDRPPAPDVRPRCSAVGQGFGRRAEQDGIVRAQVRLRVLRHGVAERLGRREHAQRHVHDVPGAHHRRAFHLEEAQQRVAQLEAERVERQEADAEARDHRLLDGFVARPAGAASMKSQKKRA